MAKEEEDKHIILNPHIIQTLCDMKFCKYDSVGLENVIREKAKLMLMGKIPEINTEDKELTNKMKTLCISAAQAAEGGGVEGAKNCKTDDELFYEYLRFADIKLLCCVPKESFYRQVITDTKSS